MDYYARGLLEAEALGVLLWMLAKVDARLPFAIPMVVERWMVQRSRRMASDPLLTEEQSYVEVTSSLRR